MESNSYFAVIGDKSIPAASPREVAEAVLRARMSGAEAAYLVRGTDEQQEAYGRELVEAWIRQLSETTDRKAAASSHDPSTHLAFGN